VRFSRLNIYARDHDTCQYCGRELHRSELNLDHVVPRAQGGKTTWENVVCSCIACNLRKGGRTPDQAGLKLLKKPVRPRWTPLTRGVAKRVTYREWLPFLNLTDASYWNVELVDE
jgi:5-methylcytosine-specific restriction endonuclease McrA